MDDKTVSAVMSYLGRKGGRPPVMRPCPKCARVVSARAMQYPCPAHTSAASRRSPVKIGDNWVIHSFCTATCDIALDIQSRFVYYL